MVPEIRRLVVQMATENPKWGYTRIQGALKNLGHCVARSTIATILKKQGIPPSGERPTSWQAFLRAHWSAFMAADFFTTEVWMLRGLVTYYTVFVIELHSRRVTIIGSTPNPDDAFMLQLVRQLTDASDGVLHEGRFLICDRDRKWSTAVRHVLETSGVRLIRTPFHAPNCKHVGTINQRKSSPMAAPPRRLHLRRVKFRVGLATQSFERDQGNRLPNALKNDPFRWNDSRHLTIIVAAPEPDSAACPRSPGHQPTRVSRADVTSLGGDLRNHRAG